LPAAIKTNGKLFYWKFDMKTEYEEKSNQEITSLAESVSVCLADLYNLYNTNILQDPNNKNLIPTTGEDPLSSLKSQMAVMVEMCHSIFKSLWGTRAHIVNTEEQLTAKARYSVLL
jgi:hypothetical protein